MKKRPWFKSQDKKKKKPFLGGYIKAKGDRVFQLTPDKHTDQIMSYNSWQAAVKDGFEHAEA